MSETDLTGQVAIVTGSGRGLGRAMTLALLERGCRVFAVDIRGELIDELAAEVAAPEALATAIVDIGEVDNCRRLVEEASATFGPPAVVVNNAVLGPDSIRPEFHVRPVRWWEVEPETVARHFAVNTIAPFALVHAALPAMLEAEYGRIINVSTSLETMLTAGFLPYGGTKAGLEAMTVMMAKDLADTDVTANVIVPGGPAATPPHFGELPEGWSRDRLLAPELMGPPVAWLASAASAGTTAKRIIAARWDADLPPTEAAAAAASDAGWPTQPVVFPV